MPTCILVVDNEPDIVDVLKKGLEANGYEVDAFTDPREALSYFKAGRYEGIGHKDAQHERVRTFKGTSQARQQAKSLLYDGI
jgi:DNA-binding response OmpR family regulator